MKGKNDFWKRCLTLFLTIVLITSFCPPVNATNAEKPGIVLNDVRATPGSVIKINVDFVDNPGVADVGLRLSFDETILTLMNLEYNSEFGGAGDPPQGYSSPVKISWGDTADQEEDLTLVTLTFKVNENAIPPQTTNIQVFYSQYDIINSKGQAVSFEVQGGQIEIIQGLPGDINADGVVDRRDLQRARQYFADWDVEVDPVAIDINGDGTVDRRDLQRARQYFADWDVEIFYGDISNKKCSHTMEEIPYKAATCEEDGNAQYWHCTKCDKYYYDVTGAREITDLSNVIILATGHNKVIIPGKEPTYEEEGYTESVKCSVCGHTFVESLVLPKMEKNIVNVIYHLEGREQDQYLINYLKDKDMSTINPNEKDHPNGVFDTTKQGYTLKGIGSVIPGYIFTGWVDEYGDSIRTIEKGQTDSIEIYATWSRDEYTVKYESTMVPVTNPDYKKYTAGQGLEALPDLKMDKYTFVGWSDKNGNVWTSIPAGTVGDVTLYANWVSERNLAMPVNTLGDPIIVEDPEKGMIFFTYEIGTITNVPLFTTLHMDVVNGLITTTRVENQTVISSENAKTVAETVSNQTTNSTSWSLQEHWDETTEVSRTEHEQTEESRRKAEEFARSHTGNYNVGVSYGKALAANVTGSSAYKLTANTGHSETNTEERGNSIDLSVDTKYSKGKTSGLSLGIPIKGLEFGINAGKSSNFEIGGGADYNQQKKNTSSGTDSVDFGLELSGETSASLTGEKSWNADIGYSSSNSNSYAHEVSVEISKLISQEYGYGETYNNGGEENTTREQEWTDEKTNEFSSTLTYFNSSIEVKTKEFQSTGNTIGDYRMVISGTVHVFAVVRYDMGTNSYSVYTLNILDDKTEEYLDYSYDGSFTDYETSYIPFEVPVFVNNYVNNRIAETRGLVFDTEKGIYTQYNASEDNKATIISVPSYYSEDNGDDTYDTYKVTGISSELFQNNTDIVGIVLGHHITEIPDDAFAGCTSLRYVICPGVTKIGDRAFRGCTSLEKFTISEYITSVGEEAFAGVPEITATATNAEIAEMIAASGARKVTMDISKIPNTERDNLSLSVGEIDTFELRGKKQEYKNLSVQSDATTTVINGVKIVDAKQIPLKLSSENVVLENETKITSSGYAMLLKAENTNVKVDGTIYMSTANSVTVIGRTMEIEPKLNNRVGKLNLTGKLLTWGNVQGQNNLTCAGIEYIDEDTYSKYVQGVFSLVFETNGGIVSENSKTVFYGQVITSLPVPTRAYHNFIGWYTESGELVEEGTIFSEVSDTTLYAHWELKPLSGWTLASEVPADAQTVNTKWTYKLTSYTTSNSSTLDGWTHYDTSSAWGEYGAWSGWSTTAAYDSDTRDAESKDEHTGYHMIAYNTMSTGGSRQFRSYSVNGNYSKYGCSSSYGEHVYTRDASISEVNSATTVAEGKYTSACSHPGYNKGNGTGYILPWGDLTYVYFINGNIYTTYYRYRDRSLIYTYYFYKTEKLESTTYPSGDNISETQEWVQYREK